jgi:peptidoglycan/LPS O-acetylase OafA/YrhL
MWFYWLHPLRGFAALGVILLHSYWTWSGYENIVVRKLYLLVDLFFILSGFVIPAGYYLKLSNFSALYSFIFKRFDRLYFHLYLSGFVWALALFLSFNEVGDVFYSAIRYFFFVDFINNAVGKLNPVAWSVMAEFWIYILFAFLIVTLKSPIAISFSAVVLSMLGLVYLSFNFVDLNLLVGMSALMRASTGFFTGFICWMFFYVFKKPAWSYVYIFAIFFWSLYLALISSNFDTIFIPIACLFILFVHNLRAPGSAKLTGFFEFIGNISYPVYMWHFIISVIFAKILNRFFSLGDKMVSSSELFVFVNPFLGDVACVFLIVASVIAAVVIERLKVLLRR